MLWWGRKKETAKKHTPREICEGSNESNSQSVLGKATAKSDAGRSTKPEKAKEQTQTTRQSKAKGEKKGGDGKKRSRRVKKAKNSEPRRRKRGRGSVIDKYNPGSYHVYVRGIRKSYFFQNTYIKSLFEQRIANLLRYFLIQVSTFALMDNHIHLVVHNRPDIAEGLSPEEVLRRARGVFPSYFKDRGVEPGDEIPKRMYKNKEIVEEHRQRLSDISWFMHRLSGYMAQQINGFRKEEGPVFEPFKAQRLTDTFALLVACIYVDLNMVRAKVVNLPEESKHCGIWYRIRAFLSLRQTGEVAPEAQLVHMLRPIHCNGDFPAPPSEAHADGEAGEMTEEQKWILEQMRIGPFENMPVDGYLAIADQQGRIARPDKRGHIPSDVDGILKRIGATSEQLMQTVEAFPHLKSAIGKPESIRAEAERRGVRSLQGIGLMDQIFRQRDRGERVACEPQGVDVEELT